MAEGRREAGDEQGLDGGAKAAPPPVRPALLVDDPAFDAHAPPAYHPERPERLTAARAAVSETRGVLWSPIAARQVTADQLARVHDAQYVEELEAFRGQTTYLDPDTYVAPGSVDAARLAAGGLVALVDAMIDGPVPRGVALLRPPGHHARPGQAMGFCLLNNVAIAAAHARARGLSRVLVVDWDVHHGNGTQEMFFSDPGVLYASTHQYPFYPGTGAVDERGEGEGTGYTLNVPLSAGGGDATYRAAFERVILPVAEAYAPDLVLISAGFDASKRDPLAEMELSAEAFGWMAAKLAAQADASARGRVALVLEGGYDLVALESGLTAAIAGLVHGATPEIARRPDDPDVALAAQGAKLSWPKIG